MNSIKFKRELLPDNQVDIWKIQLVLPDPLVKKCEKVLSPDETERMRRFVFERDRKNYTVARSSLRIILSRYLGVKPERIRFSYTPFGKPQLDPASHPNAISFNLSHSGNLALVAIARKGMIGIDIEYMHEKKDMKDIYTRYFSTSEIEAIDNLPRDKKTDAFYSYWTCKEAFVKAVGKGLQFPLDRFSVSFRAQGTPEISSIDHARYRAEQWSLRSLNIGDDYRAAVAFTGRDVPVTFMN